MRSALRPSSIEASPRTKLYRNLLQETRQLPGVAGAGLINNLPLHGQMWVDSVEFVEAPRRDLDRPLANFRFFSPGYDEGIGLALLTGRRLAESDFGREAMWISESLARQYPGRSPIGMHMQWQDPDTNKPMSLEVAGVVRDVRANAEQTPIPVVYIPYWIWPPWNPSLVIRTAANPAGVAAGVQRMIRRTHGEVPILRSKPCAKC